MVHEVTLLFLILALIVLIVEVSAVMLRLTGLDIDTARFQAVSIITASGYTTAESELVTRHPVRRKIAMFLMISGTVALAFLISILVRILGAGFTGLQDIFLVLSALLLVYLLIRNPGFVRFFSGHLERRLARQPALRKRNMEELLRLDEKHSIAEVQLINPKAFCINKTLGEVRLRDRGILILSIRRDGKTLHAPRGTDDLRQGDILLAYGRPENISRLIDFVT